MAQNSTNDLERYARQLALPEFTYASQNALKNAYVLMAGAGGLGAAALPYLAAAGIGQITIFDGDDVELSNLHRQTIFKTYDVGKNKAELAGQYLKALNPECEVITFPQHLNERSANTLDHLDFGFIIDGTDNFETKSLLNTLSIEYNVPYITASIFREKAMAGLFYGAGANTPCYHCLFPELPNEAQNCSEAGLLGPVAGIAGLMIAQITLKAIAFPGTITPGDVVNMDFERYHMSRLKLDKRTDCAYCKDTKGEYETMNQEENIPLINPKELEGQDYILVDVRTDDEVANAPFANALHIELHNLPTRMNELPKDKLLAFACAGNVRSRQAAEFMASMGYDDVCVYDVLAG